MTTKLQLQNQIADLKAALATCQSARTKDEQTITDLKAEIAALEGSAPAPASPSRYYSDASPFNKQVVAGAPIHANSPNMVARLGVPAQLSVGATGIRDWTHPLYKATPNDPLFRIVSSGWKNMDIEGAVIHVPNYAKPAGGDDASMAVVQPPNTQGEVWEYDFWRGKAPAAGVQACDFGRRGLFNGDGLGHAGTPDRGGITAARFSNALGVIRWDEMEAGVIPHALFISVHGWNGRKWPSVLSGGTTGEDTTDTYAPAMGQRFYLDMTATELLSYPVWQRTILEAMVVYGLYVGDNGTAPWALQLESGTQYLAQGKADPWVAWAKSKGAAPDVNGIYKMNFAAGVDLSRLRALA